MRTPRSGRSLLVVALGIGALSGCSILEPETLCTLIGCGRDGLTVRLTSLPTGPYRVELLVPGTGPQRASYAYECDGGSSCRQEIVFPELFLSHVLVEVTTVAGSLVTEHPNVEYVETYPNGRDCPPPCLNATVTAEIPV